MVKVDLEVKLRSTASDASTLANVHRNIIDFGKLLLDATTVKITASVASAQGILRSPCTSSRYPGLGQTV